MKSIAVLITTHNRRETTLSCLSRLEADIEGLSLNVFLVDAGSGDGTTIEISRKYPDIDITHVGTDVYWGEGMRIADAKSKHLNADFQLMLNDDVVLHDGAIKMLIDCSNSYSDRAIIVGHLVDDEGRASYGGLISTRTPLTLSRLSASETGQECDTFNGNVVLVPRQIRQKLELIDARFPHAMGDVDLGLRARRMGFAVVQAGGVSGTCNRNPVQNEARSAISRLRDITRIKRLPVRPWLFLCLRYGGRWSVLLFLKPYIEAVIGSDRSSRMGGASHGQG